MRVVGDRIKLLPEENEVLEEAHRIVAERAEKECGSYDDKMLEWRLLGKLNTGQSTADLLEWARTAPFQRKRKCKRGYA